MRSWRMVIAWMKMKLGPIASQPITPVTIWNSAKRWEVTPTQLRGDREKPAYKLPALVRGRAATVSQRRATFFLAQGETAMLGTISTLIYNKTTQTKRKETTPPNLFHKNERTWYTKPPVLTLQHLQKRKKQKSWWWKASPWFCHHWRMPQTCPTSTSWQAPSIQKWTKITANQVSKTTRQIKAFWVLKIENNRPELQR